MLSLCSLHTLHSATRVFVMATEWRVFVFARVHVCVRAIMASHIPSWHSKLNLECIRSYSTDTPSVLYTLLLNKQKGVNIWQSAELRRVTGHDLCVRHRAGQCTAQRKADQKHLLREINWLKSNCKQLKLQKDKVKEAGGFFFVCFCKGRNKCAPLYFSFVITNTLHSSEC